MSEAAVQFPCSSCGGQLLFDAESQTLKCRHCAQEKTIEAIVEEPEEHALNFEDDDPSRYDWQTEQQTVSCETCGGQTVVAVSHSSFVCSFCGSAKVLLLTDDNVIRPESLIPFQITKEKALEDFRSWQKKRWFVPNHFKRQEINNRLTGIYIPFWTYDCQTVSVYSADVGTYHYREETRTRTVDGKTETYTETVRYTVWHSTSGSYSLDFDDIRVPASGYYNEDLLERMDDFDLSELVGFKPEYISGFVTERYNVTLEDGWSSAKERIDSTLEDDIRREIGGDEISNLQIGTHYHDPTYKQVLLPIWNADYLYKDKTYPCMINGQTGSVYGKTPKSAVKITLFSLLVVICILLVIYLVTR